MIYINLHPDRVFSSLTPRRSRLDLHGRLARVAVYGFPPLDLPPRPGLSEPPASPTIARRLPPS